MNLAKLVAYYLPVKLVSHSLIDYNIKSLFKEPKIIIKHAQLRKTVCYQSVMLLSLISHMWPWGCGIQLVANHSGPNFKAQYFAVHTASSSRQQKTPEACVGTSREWGQRRSTFCSPPHTPWCNASGSH